MKNIIRLTFIFFVALAGCKSEEILPSKAIIVGWGDDFTYGTPGNDHTYLTELAKLTGMQTYNLGFYEKNSTQVKNRMIADSTLHSYPTVIWISKYRLTSEIIKSNIAEMVASLGHSNFLVLGLVNDHDGHQEKGDEVYEKIIRLNADLAGIYGDRFMDIRTFLISQYNTSNPADVKDHDLDVIPESLRDGATNLNEKAFNLVAGHINTEINLLRGDSTSTVQ